MSLDQLETGTSGARGKNVIAQDVPVNECARRNDPLQIEKRHPGFKVSISIPPKEPTESGSIPILVFAHGDRVDPVSDCISDKDVNDLLRERIVLDQRSRLPENLQSGEGCRVLSCRLDRSLDRCPIDAPFGRVIVRNRSR